MTTPQSLAPISAPHIQSICDKSTACVWGAWGMDVYVHSSSRFLWLRKYLGWITTNALSFSRRSVAILAKNYIIRGSGGRKGDKCIATDGMGQRVLMVREADLCQRDEQ